MFFFRFFEANFQKEHYSPSVLVSICDSVQPDVQQFGRKLLSQHFEEQDGEEYLFKLSEHPDTNVQLFVTNYLREYGQGKISQLESYCLRALGQVNQGRTAKKRLHHFLQEQALASSESAEIVVRILTRQVAARAIEERAAALSTLTLITQTWPELSSPLKIREPELRGAR